MATAIAERRSIDRSARPVPAKLAHVVLRTARFAEMRHFYLRLLGASVAFETDDLCFMTYDDEHHRLGVVKFPHLAAMNPQAAGLEHTAFTFTDLGALLSAYVHLKAEGIEPFWAINHGPTVSMYYHDPDGNKVEFQHDVFATNAEIDAYFASGAHTENFMGIMFDPEDLVRRYEAGEPIEELTARPPLPAGVSPWDMLRH